MIIKFFPVITSLLLLASCNDKTSEQRNHKPETMKDSMQCKSGYADINGLHMYYEIYGEGKPLVLIHGGGSTIGTSFGRVIPQLSRSRMVIAVELQGHGHTADVDRPESFEQDADDVAGLLKYLKTDKADFLGFSNGGNTAMRIAMRHPQLVHRLVVASAFYKREGMVKGFFEGMEKAALKDMPEDYKNAFLQINNDTSKLRTMFEKDRARMVQFKDWKDEELASIKAPTFIIAGDKDVITTEHTVAMSRLIPDCQLAIFPGEHGKYLGELSTIKNGDPYSACAVKMIEEFLNAPTK